MEYGVWSTYPCANRSKVYMVGVVGVVGEVGNGQRVAGGVRWDSRCPVGD